MTAEYTISLICRTPAGSDADGQPYYTETSRTIYAEEIGTKRSEFYSAMAAGLKPEKTLTIFAFEYNGEKIVEIGGQRFQVLRTYPINDERLELICTDIAEAG